MKTTISIADSIIVALAFGNIIMVFYDKSEWGNKIRAICGWIVVILYLLF